MKPPQGNGSGKFEITTLDMGGWVRVFTASLANVPDDLPIYLSHSLAEWFRHRPHLHLRCVVPVSRNGDTVELHAWYETHLFAPTTSAPTPRP